VTRGQAVGILLVLLGVVYAGLYFAWQRKRRRYLSAAVAVDRGPTGDPAPGIVTGSRGEDSDREPGIQVAPSEADYDVRAEGTYISTTTARSRHERVTVEGLGNPSVAVLLVHRGDAEHLVEIRRTGEQDVFITAERLKAFRRDRGMAGKFLGSPRLAVLTWRADDGALYETGFLPRHRADLERIEAALWWHTGARELQEPVKPPDPGLTADYEKSPETSTSRTEAATGAEAATGTESPDKTVEQALDEPAEETPDETPEETPDETPEETPDPSHAQSKDDV
jgi:hypothetical protein